MLDNNTAGTWSFNRFDNSVSSDKAGLICYVQGDPERSEYDGKLMARAAYLYDACKYLCDFIEAHDLRRPIRLKEINDMLESLDE